MPAGRRALKAAAFDYERPASLGQAIALIADAGREARLIAGGQSLVPMMAMRLVRPGLLVDLNDVAELAGIARAGDRLLIGAATRQRTAERSALVRRHLPLLAAALPWVGHLQTRNRGTVGGSLAHADPSAEIALVAVTLGAEMVLRDLAGTRTLPAATFLEGPMQTAIRPDEILAETRWPLALQARRVGVGFAEVNARASDFAILAAAAEVVLDAEGICRQAALGVGGASPVPLKAEEVEAALTGRRLEDAHIDAASRLIADRLQPSGDLQASSGYRRRVAPGLLARAIGAARDQALESH